MKKFLEGAVISTAMQDTVVVEIVRRIPHPLYRKLLKRSKKFKVALNGKEVQVGDVVRITPTKPVAKGKYFEVMTVLGKETK